ncbi:MAG: hypothetical protein JWM78_1161 [Verrucomicrobiaceae bacterium]|nr:hypothetical protein [Verrucomicrobiaceae bacterium]
MKLFALLTLPLLVTVAPRFSKAPQNQSRLTPPLPLLNSPSPTVKAMFCIPV